VEVILATNPTVEGDGTAVYIQRRLQSFAVKITRIAKGIPSGSSLEYANLAVVSDAIQGRKPLS
jgi:recombination protein RecR